MAGFCRNCAAVESVGSAGVDTVARLLVVGYGNTLRRDDGLGVQLAQILAGRAEPGVEVLVCHQLTPELAEPLSRAAAALFVDAAVGGPKQVRIRRLKGRAASVGLAHQCDPTFLLALARRVYGVAPPAWLLTLPGEDFGLGEGFSPLGWDSLQQALRTAERWIARRRSSRPRP